MLYDYQCKQCKAETEAINKVDERNTNAPVCCDEPMVIIIKQAPMGYMGRTIDYICPVTNEHVTTKRQRRNIMAENNLKPAHELMQSKEARNAAEQRSKDLTAQSQNVPKEVREHVIDWAKKAARL